MMLFLGTYQIKKSDGVKEYVAQNIRNFSNSELVRKIQNHLRGLKFDEEKIPGRTYMEKILNSLPAKKAKQMKGLCDTVDEGMHMPYIFWIFGYIFCYFRLHKNVIFRHEKKSLSLIIKKVLVLSATTFSE